MNRVRALSVCRSCEKFYRLCFIRPVSLPSDKRVACRWMRRSDLFGCVGCAGEVGVDVADHWVVSLCCSAGRIALIYSCLYFVWSFHLLANVAKKPTSDESKFLENNLTLYGIITLPLLTCKRLIMNQMSLLYLHWVKILTLLSKMCGYV